MPEVSDQQLALYQKLVGLHDSLYQDESLGLEFKQLLKKKFPKLAIPEIDAAKPHVEKMGTIEKELADLKQRLQDEKLESDFIRRFSDTRREFNLTDEGMEKVKKLMTENNIPDPRAAAALMLHEKPPEPISPSGFGAQRWDFLNGDSKAEQDDITSLINDPDAWLDKTIGKVLAEERSNKRLAVGV